MKLTKDLEERKDMASDGYCNVVQQGRQEPVQDISRY